MDILIRPLKIIPSIKGLLNPVNHKIYVFVCLSLNVYSTDINQTNSFPLISFRINKALMEMYVMISFIFTPSFVLVVDTFVWNNNKKKPYPP